MTKYKGLVKLSLIGLAAGVISFSGCGGIGDEEMQQLQQLRDEVSSLTKSVGELRQESAKLEREQGEQKSKLEQCAKDKEATSRNLQKLPK